ncbi:MAG: PAS domain S-box protein, partial [Candidatus Eisenbacteria bacterium]|nr:PAS domain S-box protein [Candidatus Eisenbacteria bacterium]
MDLDARRYEAALAHQAYGIVLLGEEGRVEFANQQLCDLFGLSERPAELTGLAADQFFELVAPACTEPIETVSLLQAILRDRSDHLRQEVVLRDGRTLVLDSTPIILDDRPAGRLWSLRDVTDSKRAQEALRLSEEKFAKAFQTSPYAIAITRLEDGVFLEINDTFSALTGFSRDELIGRSALQLGIWANEDQRVAVATALQHQQPVVGREVLFRDSRGGLSTCVFTAQPINLSQGPCIISSVDNITERKRAEHELQTSRRLLSDVVEHAGALISVKDRDGRYVLVNKKWEEVHGLKRDECIGRTDADLFPGPLADEWRANDLKVMESQAEVETEETLADPDGKRFFISIRFPVYEDDGSVHGVCAMVTEITARKEIEERIRHLATHDSLTDLPSLSLAKDRLRMAFGMARRQKAEVGVMFVDLDGFKSVNDTLGHETGDLVLRETAKRLLSCVRETDTVARIGGDEFLIVVGGLHGKDDAARIAQKIVSRVGEPVVLDSGRQVSVGASVGIALCLVCGDDADRLIKLADAAMYRVKNAGKNG